MSSLAMTTLRDGSEVPMATLFTVTRNLKKAAEANSLALLELIKKCEDVEYAFAPNCGSEAFLKEHSLIHETTGKIHEHIKNVVLNSIKVEWKKGSLKFVDPLQSKNVTVVERSKKRHHGSELKSGAAKTNRRRHEVS